MDKYYKFYNYGYFVSNGKKRAVELRIWKDCMSKEGRDAYAKFAKKFGMAFVMTPETNEEHVPPNIFAGLFKKRERHSPHFIEHDKKRNVTVIYI